MKYVHYNILYMLQPFNIKSGKSKPRLIVYIINYNGRKLYIESKYRKV